VPSDPEWYLYDTTYSGVCFQRVFHYYNLFVYTYPNVSMRANLPPETYAVGWELSAFYPPGEGTFSITLSSGEMYQFQRPTVFFGVVSDEPIRWVSETLSNTYPIFRDFHLTASAASVASCPPPDDTTGPVVTDLAATPDPVAVDTAVTISATVDDESTGGSIVSRAQYSIDGLPWTDMIGEFGTSTTVDVWAPLGAFTTAGVYNVCVVGQDEVGNTGDPSCVPLTVYDPSGGFVVGGGWFESPPGAFPDDLAAWGKASFGLVSKYTPGANVPTGNTQFTFRAGHLRFHSTSYDWLVVGGSRAQYSGWGTVNGEPGYRFMITAIDGESEGGGGIDRIRVKIWLPGSGIVYDNQMGMDDSGTPSTVLGGGSIKIQR
jgi:hypothetical protein